MPDRMNDERLAELEIDIDEFRDMLAHSNKYFSRTDIQKRIEIFDALVAERERVREVEAERDAALTEAKRMHMKLDMAVAENQSAQEALALRRSIVARCTRQDGDPTVEQVRYALLWHHSEDRVTGPALRALLRAWEAESCTE